MKLTPEIILEHSYQLPAMPTVINDLMEKFDNPNVSAKQFQDIIMQDPMLTAKILKLSNSAYYGFARKIKTISEAVVILGMQSLKSLVLSISAFSVLNKSIKGYDLVGNTYWEHSLAVAVIAKALAKFKKLPDAEIFFVGGLLHDIGLLALNRFLTKESPYIQHYMQENNVPFYIAEHEVLGMNHPEAGAVLAKFWRLPDILVKIIHYHHTPSDCPVPDFLDYVNIVCLADHYSQNIQKGLGSIDFGNEEIVQTLEQKYEIKSNMKTEFFAFVEDEINKFAQHLQS